MLSPIMGFADITSWAIKVQERLDGSGYIYGLEAKDLAFKDRVLTVISAYNALREKKEYRNSFSHEEAIEILKNTSKYLQIPSYLNIGIAYYKLNSIHNAKIYLDRIFEKMFHLL